MKTMFDVSNMKSFVCLSAMLLVVECNAGSGIIDGTSPIAPEAASGYHAKAGWATRKFAVAAANPLAATAGYQILKEGGSAIDAAVAVQLVLGLVEPQSSGLGGGAFLLHFNGKSVEAFDGRETAPAAADEKLFLNAEGMPMAFYDASIGGRAVGTPGVISMLELAHQQYGKLAWARLFEPAIYLAEHGFEVSPRLAGLLRNDNYLRRDAAAAAYFYPHGQPLEAGVLLRNPAYGEVLRKIARMGSRGLLEGSVAQAIVDKVNRHPTNPGRLNMHDLEGYKAIKRESICSDYAAKTSAGTTHDYRICGMPPPSSGGITVTQIIGILSYTDASLQQLSDGTDSMKGKTTTAEFLRLYTEASRLAFADRSLYLGDPDFVRPPGGHWSSLIAPDYLAERAKLISTGPGAKNMKTAKPGVPGLIHTAYAPMPEQREYGTSHISIVDGNGNAISMTSSIEDQFGARLLTDGGTGKAGGFLLNNELTDFSMLPKDAEGKLIANRVQPGKRPRSSMAPTLVFEKSLEGGNGPLVAVVGSPGGAMIIHFTAKTLYGILNWNLNAQEAIDLPNFGILGGPILLEQKRFSPALLEQLRTYGAEVKEIEMTSGLQAIQKTQYGFFGGADPRREGVVRGD